MLVILLQPFHVKGKRGRKQLPNAYKDYIKTIRYLKTLNQQRINFAE